ncbi:hypothetical protein OESDEN_17973 [Oesophagostomum dentatum]|uniref:Uncharacterized protein n=1 Tax=Oesophagostomum dentatum TaxID=61180 RepID=A0A0B1SBN0_OESDE|nr:hypothetical protein OESDEN_17973 [Oesophagostomum dentatum]
MQKLVDDYNAFAVPLYQKFMAAAASDHKLIAPEFALSHREVQDLFLKNELASPVFEGYSPDSSFLPVLTFDERDHRGRKIWYNAFAVAFFIHESRQKLISINQLRVSNMWYLLHDFIAILQRLADGLEAVARQQDPVAELLRDIYDEYYSKFCSAFGMRAKN